MASRVTFERWLLRDLPYVKVVFVWIAFGCSVFFYLSDWPPHRREAAVRPPSSNIISINQNDNDEVFTGSIVISPTRGEQCWERRLDNRTGKMWDKGFVNCYEVVPQEQTHKFGEGTSAKRIRAIGKAFSRGRE